MNISCEKAFERNAKGEIVFLDVRSLEEIKEGKIKGAICIDINDKEFSSKVKKLDKSKEYVVYCHSGGRSSYAIRILEMLGFRVHNLAGGIVAWIEDGFKLEKS